MRELFESLPPPETLDATEAARRAMRPQLRQRLYRHADIDGSEGQFRVTLDGRPVRTPARNVLAAPVRALAQALAAEWEAQRERIHPGKMPLTRLANTIIDGVANSLADVTGEVQKYLASDLLLYRAEHPEGLVGRQALAWDPVLAWAERDLGARFVLARGLIHVAQPQTAIAAAARAIPCDPWRLGALHAVTTLTGSALLALAVAAGAVPLASAWAAANVDEDWNLELWGHDELALAHRAARFAEFEAASLILALVEAR